MRRHCLMPLFYVLAREEPAPLVLTQEKSAIFLFFPRPSARAVSVASLHTIDRSVKFAPHNQRRWLALASDTGIGDGADRSAAQLELPRDLHKHGRCQPAPHPEGVRAGGQADAGDRPDLPATEGVPYPDRPGEAGRPQHSRRVEERQNWRWGEDRAGCVVSWFRRFRSSQVSRTECRSLRCKPDTSTR